MQQRNRASHCPNEIEVFATFQKPHRQMFKVLRNMAKVTEDGREKYSSSQTVALL